ncbi:MAG: hypothetical protein ACD_69C00230G0001, partial [uncultured bacterium]
QTIYVSKSGSDSNDGSIVSPFLTVAHAVTVANSLASYPLNPVTINIGPGIFFENPMTINTNYIFLVGQSIIGTTIAPADPTQNLITISAPYSFFGILNMSFTCYGVSSATALSITTNSPGFIELNNISLNQFQTAIQIGGVAGSAFVLATNIQGVNNGTNIAINNAQISLKNGNFVGGTDLITPANTGITANGSDTIAYISDSTFALLNTGISVTNNATFNLLGSNFRTNINGITANGTSDILITSCQFSLNDPTTTNITASDSGTKFYIEGCLFDCEDASDNPQGTCVKVYNGAKVTLSNSIIDEAIIGIDCGQAGEAAPATITSSDTTLRECSTGIKQVNSSKVYFTGGKFDSTKLNIAIPTNCLISSFDVSGKLSFGSKTDIQNTIYSIVNGQANSPELTYEPNYYGYKGTIFKNSNTGTNGAAINATQSDLDNAAYFVVTGDNTKEAKISLISDSNTIGAAGSDRGWDITKLSSAELAFKYFDNDPGAVRGLNTVMQLNGYDNQVEFPVSANTPLPTNATGAKLVWAPSLDGNSTNLYRSATGTLTTDANFTVGGTLTVPDSAAGTPTINFDGMTGTGFSAQSNTLSLNTAGAQRMSINPTGAVFVNSFSGGASGVVHASTTGQLTNSLIIGSDIATNTIPDSKLQTISTSGKVANSATTATNSGAVGATGTIVMREAVTGNFDTIGIITANTAAKGFVGNLQGNADTATSATTAGSATNFTGTLGGDVIGTQSTTHVNTVATLNASGASSPVYTGITAANAATPNNTPNTIVKRDANGYFSATGITASLTGAASLNVLKSGDTMSGPLNINYGSSSATTPSLSIGSTGVGIYSDLANNLSFETNGSQRINIGSTGAVSINSLLNVAGLANFATGVNITGALNVTGATNFATGVTFAAASAANPSIKFAGSTNTGLSAATANTLSFDTSGTEKMNIDSAGTVTVNTGPLVVPARTAASPSIQFTGGTNTGFSSATANRISFDTSATEKMFIGPDATSSALGIGRLLPVFDQAIQLENTSPVAVNATTSILVYSGAGSFTISNFPANPANGQLFTIMLGVSDTATHIITYPANTVATSNNITSLDTNAFTSTSGGKSVTYIYLPTGGTTANRWYCFSRG